MLVFENEEVPHLYLNFVLWAAAFNTICCQSSIENAKRNHFDFKL